MAKRRICLLTDGRLDIFTAKTAVGLLRYCPDEVVAILDRSHAGENPADVVGCGDGIPIVDSIEAARTYSPNQMLIGVALPGGTLPDGWREILLGALAGGMDVISGLHERLNDDPEFSDAALKHGQTITDVRAVQRPPTVGAAQALGTKACRILTVGSDCNLGKRVTALELVKEMKRRKLNAEFLPTGQTGVMISGRGVSIDAIISDFVSGAVEQGVLSLGDADYVIVEGQGALFHPSYSSVTLGLLHGCLPDKMILCHAPGRQTIRNLKIPMPSLAETIHLYEAAVKPIHPAKVVGISLNCHGMNDSEYKKAVSSIKQETGLPTADSIRDGVGVLVDCVLQ